LLKRKGERERSVGEKMVERETFEGGEEVENGMREGACNKRQRSTNTPLYRTSLPQSPWRNMLDSVMILLIFRRIPKILHKATLVKNTVNFGVLTTAINMLKQLDGL
jgi:hypothetical protein